MQVLLFVVIFLSYNRFVGGNNTQFFLRLEGISYEDLNLDLLYLQEEVISEMHFFLKIN